MTAAPCKAGPLIQSFFLDHLLRHKHVSPRTVAAYRDALCLLLRFAQQRLNVEPTALGIADLDAPFILEFLDHLERDRANSARSRNARLAAVRSLFRFVALHEPQCLAVATRVLSIPSKRTERRLVGYLTRVEIDAILSAPDQHQWSGRRDHALLLTLYNTGARVSEISLIRRHHISFDPAPSIELQGKGRKQRAIPLWARTARVLRRWFTELNPGSQATVFPSARGQPLTRHGIAFVLDTATMRAREHCASLADKHVSPHVVRHSTAMHLLQSGVDPTVIALWLGHESLETTHIYVEADLTMKRQALEKLSPAGIQGRRFKPSDAVLGFLANL